MEASRSEPPVLEGLSRFLVRHERCGAGFDVVHPAGLGRGRVVITCRGCGEQHEYGGSATETGREGARTDSLVEAPPPTPRPASHRPPRTEQPAAEGGPASVDPARDYTEPAAGWQLSPPRRRMAPAVAIPLAALAAAALTFGVIKLAGGGDETPRVATSGTAPAVNQAAPGEPSNEAKPAPAPKPALAGAERLQTAQFAVSVPAGWTHTPTADLGEILRPTGADQTQIQIYYKIDPALGSAEMVRKTVDLLKQHHSSAAISPVRHLSVWGVPGYKVSSRWPGGTETAVGAISRDYRYLVLSEVASDSPSLVQRQAVAVSQSFRPG